MKRKENQMNNKCPKCNFESMSSVRNTVTGKTLEWCPMCKHEEHPTSTAPIAEPKDRMPILWQSAFAAAYIIILDATYVSQLNDMKGADQCANIYVPFCLDVADAAVKAFEAAEQMASEKKGEK